MTEPSQYFKGRTVQEQMNEVIGYVDTRAAEVATTAIASDVAQVHQDMLDADADAQAAAASAAAAAGTLANAVKKTGEASQNIEGDVNLTTGDLGVAGDAGVQGQLSVLGGCDLRAPVKIPVSPANDDDAASKKYVDDHHDATKIDITDINNYAVGLTGNQDNIAGSKTFVNLINGRLNRQFTTGASGVTLLYKRTATRQQWLLGVSGHSLVIANVQGNTKINTRVISNNDRPYTQPIMYVCRDSEDVITVWGVGKYSAAMNWYLLSNMQYGSDYTNGIEAVNQNYSSVTSLTVGATTPYDSNATFTEVYASTDFEYVR